MSDAYLKLRAINKNAFEGEANLDDGLRLEVFLMQEGAGWHLGIRFFGYFHFRLESSLDGTYGAGYLFDKINFMYLSTAERLQRLLKQFFKIYHNGDALKAISTNGYFTVHDLKDSDLEEHEE